MATTDSAGTPPHASAPVRAGVQILPERYSWSLDFLPIESALIKIEFGAKNKPQYNSDTEAALNAAVTAFPLPMDDVLLRRIVFLAAQIDPGIRGQRLAALLLQYYHYHQESLGLAALTARSADLLAMEQNFEKLVALRRHHFGESAAHALFDRQQALAEFMLARQRIRSDATLTDAQRHLLLASLKQRFQETINAVDSRQ